MSDTKDYIRVSDVMTRDVETIDGLASVEEAMIHMQEKHYGALIVAKRDESDEYGFITVQGIARGVIEPNLSPSRVNIYQIMSKPVLTVHADMNIRYAIRLLEQVDQGRALVIEDGEAIGIVTMYDMVVHYLDNKDSAKK